MSDGPRKVRFTVPASDAGRRLDQVLADHVPGLSRRKARVLLDIGGVFVDRTRVKAAGKTMRAGQSVEAVLGGALDRATSSPGKDARAKDESFLPPFAVIHEDEDLIVVDKPAGLLSAPTPESDRNNLADLLARRAGKKNTKDETAIFVVHRLDLQTSGLLMFAKNDDANRELSRRFREHDLTREYLAVVAGAFPETATTVESPIDGKRAVTHFAIEERLGAKATFLRARLETGRTHQIRIHARLRGCPVLGDAKHGGVPPEGLPQPPRMALHATRLAIVHPRTAAPLEFTSPWPADLAAWLATLR